jgi:iron complex transport system ATP-binding protein
MLSIHNLCVSYHKNPILHHIDLDLKEGEILSVVGPNGVGKSTLIRAISGVIKLDAGEIKKEDQDITHLPPDLRARYIAVVPQARHLPGDYTVHQTVMMGRTPYLGWLGSVGTRDQIVVDQTLQQTELEPFSERLVGELSGGEQQRVLLARALAQKTPVLLLDEPTAHLDLQHQTSILNLVKTAVSENHLAVLMVLHDLNLVTLYADRVALMVAGKIQCIGTPEAVLTSENIEYAYHVKVHIIPHPVYGTPLILPDGKIGEFTGDASQILA